MPLLFGPQPLWAQTPNGLDDARVLKDIQKLEAAARQLNGRFRVLLDPGHTPAHPGAISSQGLPERGYNQNIAALLLKRLAADGDIQVSLSNGINDTVENLDRAKLANKLGVDAFIAIHHDSAQDIYLSTWTFNGAAQNYCDRFQGYSVHVADDKPQPLAQKSYLLAELAAAKLSRQGFSPTLHHAEPIAGENFKLLDRSLGIYQRNNLAVFRTNQRPAILVECGVIINREEEKRMQDPAVQARLVEALYQAVREFKKRAGSP